jgi:signal peptidase I
VSATPPTRGVLHYTRLGLSAGLLGLVGLLALILVVVPFVSGSTPMTILTSSMEPRLPPGTLIVVKPTPADQIAIGDVMTYQIRSGDPAVVSHRVIGVSSSSDGGLSFTTQGDNNDSPDQNPVIEAQIRGVVWYSVPWVGYVSTAVNGQNRSWIVPATAIALLAYAGFMVVSGVVGTVRKKRRATPEPIDPSLPDVADAASDEVWSARPAEPTASVARRR